MTYQECACTSVGIGLLGFGSTGIRIIRSKVRGTYKISGSVIEDFMLTICCPCKVMILFYKIKKYSEIILYQVVLLCKYTVNQSINNIKLVKKRINQDSSRFTVLFLPKIFYFLFGLSINYILIYYSYLKVNYLICGKNIYIRFSNFKIVLTLKNNYNCSIKSHKNNNKIIMSFFSQIKFYYYPKQV